ncbi:MAG TPA: outer membrane protein assembly factor BamE [Acetobacteraceae bacterium]|jgi:outer membrane protein assembly factor BamE (lipoprotein component of BamABCDE complex)|nr:outer membrane protein assembly factor BamE [Acetobacteraceae bacterium]
MPRLTLLRTAALGTSLLLAGCGWLAPPPIVRGNHPEADQLKELVPGTSTKQDVTSLLGSPTAHATFDDNTWLYIGERTQKRVGQVPAVLTQKVVVMTFNDAGVLQHIDARDQADAMPVSVVAQTTPSPGTEANFFQELFGNIGRFVPVASGPSGGGGAPAPAQ